MSFERFSTTLLAAVISLGVCSFGCTRKVIPAQGELLLLLSSDMQVPDSFTTLVVTLDSEPPGTRHVYIAGPEVKSSWLSSNDGTTPAADDCFAGSGDLNSTNLKLPSTLGLTSKTNDARDAILTVTACNPREKVFSAHIPVTLPAQGDTKLLEVPIRWLCADKAPGFAMSCYSCGGGSRCYGNPITVDENATSPCRVSACAQDGTSYPKHDYDGDVTSRFHAGATSCFDVMACFGESVEAVAQFGSGAVVDWEERPLGDAKPNGPCVARVEGPLDKLNFAIELPAGTYGTCSRMHCLVPLDAKSSLGWQENVSELRPGYVQLPNAICNMLDSGQILSLVQSNNCAKKTSDVPVCGTGNISANYAEAKVNFATALKNLTTHHYTLDSNATQNEPIVDDGKEERLDLGYKLAQGFTNVNLPVAGVVGNAQAFTGQFYAISDGRLNYKSDYALSLFVSLTENEFKLTNGNPSMPLISSISKECQDGFRLQLDPCDDHREIRLAFATPTEKDTNGQCTLTTHSATFASRSWLGGYFTPWKQGDFRHVVVSVTAGNDPVFYIDGNLVETKRGTCVATSQTSTLSDDSRLYLGGSAQNASSMTAPSPRVELDEVALYDQPLTDNEVLLLNAYTTTELGPSGRRWGAWATQGGSAFVDSSVPEKVTAILNDTAYSSSGVFALLGPEKNPYEPLDLSNADLSAFDEAVLRASWVGLPANSRSFQFALSSEHGKRQCTWQLTASEQPYYVINLRQPSWCVDPTCQFDTTNVERASIAADWTSAEGKVQFDVQALSFRKRIMSPADGSNGIATRLGGRSGDPGNFCWRPVSFYSDSLARLYPPLEGTGLDVRSSGGNGNAPALTADLFGGADAKRDFTQCPYVLAQTAAALPSNEDFRVVLTNEDGQTWSCSLAHSGTGNSYGVALESSTACFAWPPNVEGATLAHPTSASEVLGSTVRIALKSTVNFQLTALQCCDSSGQNCHDIDDAWPPSVNP